MTPRRQGNTSKDEVRSAAMWRSGQHERKDKDEWRKERSERIGIWLIRRD